MSPMAERTPLKLTRETEPEGELIEIPPVTSKNVAVMLRALLESNDGKAMYRDGVRVQKQKAAWDREAEDDAAQLANPAFGGDQRHKVVERQRRRNNRRYPQLPRLAEQLGDAGRHNSAAHIGGFLNDDREGLRFLREDGVQPDNNERIPGIGRSRGQLLVKLEGLEAEATKGHEYQDHLQAACNRLAELELSSSIDVNAELATLVQELGEPPFPCCPTITVPGSTSLEEVK